MPRISFSYGKVAKLSINNRSFDVKNSKIELIDFGPIMQVAVYTPVL
jgi:hypothetical protein